MRNPSSLEDLEGKSKGKRRRGKKDDRIDFDEIARERGGVNIVLTQHIIVILQLILSPK